MSNPLDAGKMMKAERKKAGWSLQRVSIEIGTDPSTITRRESQRMHDGFSTMLHHYLALGLDPVEIYGLQKAQIVGLRARESRNNICVGHKDKVE